MAPQDYDFRGQHLGWGPWRRNWSCICSIHGGAAEENRDCDMCMTGMYYWCISRAIGHFIYQHNPSLWRWWANLPNSRSRRFLRRTFPNLEQ
jgi:hypothetical protein